ncbi:hypothetical protein Tco_1080865 [Tanacetum coccineum]|uniref:Uncharacterized protein n=1 Tax=Tanacetum coccineum TaxID=301880 RepID=A0ABQ5HVZ6_9ASTR
MVRINTKKVEKWDKRSWRKSKNRVYITIYERVFMHGSIRSWQLRMKLPREQNIGTNGIKVGSNPDFKSNTAIDAAEPHIVIKKTMISGYEGELFMLHRLVCAISDQSYAQDSCDNGEESEGKDVYKSSEDSDRQQQRVQNKGRRRAEADTHSAERSEQRQATTRDQAKKSKGQSIGLRGRTSTFLIGITDDDNDNLGSHATKAGNIIDVDLTTIASLPPG